MTSLLSAVSSVRVLLLCLHDHDGGDVASRNDVALCFYFLLLLYHVLLYHVLLVKVKGLEEELLKRNNEINVKEDALDRAERELDALRREVRELRELKHLGGRRGGGGGDGRDHAARLL